MPTKRSNTLKMTLVVNVKLAFMDWFFYNLVTLFKQCKISYENLGKVLLFLRSHIFCVKNWTFWWVPTTIEKICTAFLLNNVHKRVFRSFFFCLELELFAKIWKDLVSTHPQKPGSSITQDLNKIKKFPNTLL